MTSATTLSSRVFLGRKLDILSALIEGQTAALFKANSITIPVRSISLLTALQALETGTAADLASHLSQTHQLVSQKLPKLVNLGLIDSERDPTDARRRVYTLTQDGSDQLAAFRKFAPIIDAAYEDLFSTYGDLSTLIDEIQESLKTTPLSLRY